MNKMVLEVAGVLTLGVVVVFGQPTFAAGGRGAGVVRSGQRSQRLAQLAAYLQLTAGQRAQIKPILKSALQQARAIRQDTSLTPEQQRAKLQALRQTAMPQILSLLTPEQNQKLSQLRKRRGGPQGL